MAQIPKEAKDAVTGLLTELQSDQKIRATVSGGASLLPTEKGVALLPSNQLQRVAEALGLGSVPAAAPAQAPASLGPWNTGPITFSGGTPVGAWANLTLFSDGSYNFSGHFHDSGGTSYNTELVWAVKSGAGVIYTFTHQGRVHGTFESGSRNDDWGNSGNNPALAAGWADLWAHWSWNWKAGVNLDIGPLLDDVKNALGVAGAIIAIV
jgi:hypothetical protein